MADVHLTAEGMKTYEERLEYLKTVARVDIAEQIKVARSFGDLSENAEYDAAKAEQGRIEYEIVEIETMLHNAVLIDTDNIDTGIVEVGSSVSVRITNPAGGRAPRETEYKIVGSAESNPVKNLISNEAPVGKALLGHKIGDAVDIQTPGGLQRFEILAIGK